MRADQIIEAADTPLVTGNRLAANDGGFRSILEALRQEGGEFDSRFSGAVASGSFEFQLFRVKVCLNGMKRFEQQIQTAFDEGPRLQAFGDPEAGVVKS